MFDRTWIERARSVLALGALTAGLVIALPAAPAQAEDLRVGARNGDTYLGDIDAPSTVDLYFVYTEPGATLRVRAKSRKGSPPIHVAVLSGASGTAGTTDSGRRVRVNSSAEGGTLHQVLVGAERPGDLADYRISFRWKVRSRVRKRLSSGPGGGTRKARVFVNEGERVRFDLLTNGRPARGPVEAVVESEVDEVRRTTGVSRIKIRPERTEEHRISVEPLGGRTPTHVVIRRRVQRRVVDVRDRAVPDLPALSVVGAVSPGVATRVLGRHRTDWGLMDVRLRVPGSAVSGHQVVALIQGEEIAQPVPGVVSTSSSIRVGPSDLELRPGELYSVELPASIRRTEDGEPVKPRVFFRDGDGNVSEIDEQRIHFVDGRPWVLVEHHEPGTLRAFVTRHPVRRAALAATVDSMAFGRPDEIVDAYANAGAVEIHRRSGDAWTQEAFLRAPDVRDDGEFGSAVALDGSSLFVAARAAESDTGVPLAGYVFTRAANGAWSLGAELTSRLGTAEPGLEAPFGFLPSIAVSGDWLAIGGFGAPYFDVAHDGRVLLYQRVEGAWTLRQVLRDRHTTELTPGFGRSVALDGSRLVVSRPTTSETSFHRNGAIVYELTSDVWEPVATLEAPDGPSGCFGFSQGTAATTVALDGDRIALSRTHVTDLGLGNSGAGQVTLFRHETTGWVEGTTLRPPSVLIGGTLDCPGSEFGAALAIRGDRLLVGAPSHGGDPGLRDGAGGAFLYRLDPTGAQLESILTPSTPAGSERFGRRVVFVPGVDVALVAGARSQHSGAANEVGRVLVFDLE